MAVPLPIVARITAGFSFAILSFCTAVAEPKQPRIVGDWWTVASDPDLEQYTDPKQQPVDFAIWQAADGSWQLWSCIRNTRCGGNTRLFYRWENKSLTNANWKPVGIALQAKADYGETPGGLQAPHVVRIEGLYHMFYGDWERICVATSVNGKDFARRLALAPGAAPGNPPSDPSILGEERGSNTRDPMAIQIDGLWHCYYTAFPKQQGAVYCRTSKDTRKWSDSKIVAFGGEAGAGPFSAECPFVVELSTREFYLFRTQKYGYDAITRVYRSTDPMNFGVNADDNHLVCSLPVAAPEIILHNGEWYIASLLPTLKGIRLARLEWASK
jgi:hypothetical protein